MGSVGPPPPFALTLEEIFGRIFLSQLFAHDGFRGWLGCLWWAGSSAGVKAVARCVCSRSLACVCAVLLRSAGQELGCVWVGLPDAPHGCEVLLSFLIDSKDLITEVGLGWQGAEDALWLSFLLPLLSTSSSSSLSSSSSSSFSFHPSFLLPFSHPSSSSSSFSFSSLLLFTLLSLLSALLCSPFPQVTAE